MLPSEYDESSASCEEARPPKKTSKKQKRFHFALSRNQIFPIPHIDDLSEEEVVDTWYERADYEKMKMSMIPLIRKIMKGDIVDETDRQTARGLEFRTRKGAIRRQHNKVEAISAVLEEQDRQIECTGYCDAEQLAAVYMEVNHHCQVEAHELALGDVQPAQEYLADVSIEYLNSQYYNSKVTKEEDRSAPGRKNSFGKLFRQMRIRRRPTLTSEASEDRPPILPSSNRPVTTSAA